jgi:hypothetical protein
MAPKRRLSNETHIILEQASGPVRWLRVTHSKDSRNKRQMYCINFYSGSREDVDAVSVFISGRSQFQMSISDHEFENININKEDYVRQRIIAAVHQRVQSQASKARLLKSMMICYNKYNCVFLCSISFHWNVCTIRFHSR